MNSPQMSPRMARRPIQPRGQERFDQVLQAARDCLLREGLGGFSIPVLAQQTGFTRASIYNFFPTPHAVLNELARTELGLLEDRVISSGLDQGQRSWKQRTRDTIHTVVGFFNERPLARLLLLGDGATDEAYKAQTLSIRYLGGLTRRLFEEAGWDIPEHPVDVASLSIELATTCLRHSVLLHGQITAAYAEEAAQVMVQYLARHVEHTRQS